MIATERDWHDTHCPRCGADAQWSFLAGDKNAVEILCADCGRIEMPREEFDSAAAENPELAGNEEAA